MPFDDLNRRFIHLKKVEFSGGQEAENYLKAPLDNLNHRFIDFIKIAFWAGQEAKKIVPSGLQPLEMSPFLIYQSRIFACN